MTTEQKKAIKSLDKFVNTKYGAFSVNEGRQILNLIKEQEKEIDCLKNHVHYMKCQNCGKEFRAKRSDARFCKKCAITVNNKEWYKNLTDEQKAKRREQSKIAMRKLREGRKNEN